MSFYKDFEIYGGDPDHPVVSTGQIYPVYVIKGYLRYTTRDERESLVFWEEKMSAWIGLPPLAAVFLWFMYRPKQARPSRQ
jgi:hypothetical protein